jgi:hypothetical protein
MTSSLHFSTEIRFDSPLAADHSYASGKLPLSLVHLHSITQQTIVTHPRFFNALLQTLEPPSPPLATLSILSQTSSSSKSPDNSLSWAAPEIISGGLATPACDVWLAGMLFASGAIY